MASPKEFFNSYVLLDSTFDSPISELSLELALRNFFGTYQAVRGFLDRHGTAGKDEKKYQVAYCETILHFHHYFELSLKEILRREHPLLAMKHPSNREFFTFIHATVTGQSPEFNTELDSAEFSATLQRIKWLREELPVQFTDEQLQTLGHLNDTRNSLWHRGLRVIEYSSLDQLVAGHLIPLAFEVRTALSNPYADHSYPEMDPVNRISYLCREIQSLSRHDYDIQRMALLKELGRATMENPDLLDPVGYLEGLDCASTSATARAQALCDYQVKRFRVPVERAICPACHLQTVVPYLLDYGPDMDVIEVTSVKCECCGFRVSPDISQDTLVAHGLPNYWENPLGGTSQQTMDTLDSPMN